jgi:hypothetical protein
MVYHTLTPPPLTHITLNGGDRRRAERCTRSRRNNGEIDFRSELRELKLRIAELERLLQWVVYEHNGALSE